MQSGCYARNWNQMQTGADAEIVVYSGENQKPGEQRYEAQNDMQENSQGCPESKKLKSSKTRNKQGQGRKAVIQRSVVYNKLAYK